MSIPSKNTNDNKANEQIACNYYVVTINFFHIFVCVPNRKINSEAYKSSKRFDMGRVSQDFES